MTSIKWGGNWNDNAEERHKARRERIATAVLPGLLAAMEPNDPRTLATKAVALADALIAELDKKEGNR